MTEPAHVPVAADEGDQPEWVVVAARAADEKLGRNTVILDVGDVLGITEYFLITTGGNGRQMKAIVDEVQLKLKQSGGPVAQRVEGAGSAEWILVDFGEFVVHVFGEDARTHYNLDRLWGDRPKVIWEDAEGAGQR